MRESHPFMLTGYDVRAPYFDAQAALDKLGLDEIRVNIAWNPETGGWVYWLGDKRKNEIVYKRFPILYYGQVNRESNLSVWGSAVIKELCEAELEYRILKAGPDYDPFGED